MLSRRRFIQTATYLTATGLMVACAPPAAPAAPKAAAPAAPVATEAPKATEAPAAAKTDGAPDRASTLIFGSDTTDMISLDPAVAYEFSGIQAEASTYETLVSPEPGVPGVKPLLAESWTTKEEGAQKSTRTGWADCNTSVSKLASLISMVGFMVH